MNITQVPWQVAIQSGGIQFCGGSIISDQWILTAAHCLYGQVSSSLQVRVGATHKYKDGQLFEVNSFTMHKEFNSIDYDFGLVELKIRLQFSQKVQSISLPNVDDAPIAADTLCLVSGWGNTKNSSASSLILRGVEVPIVDQHACNRAYSGRITDRMICAGFKHGGKDCKFKRQQLDCSEEKKHNLISKFLLSLKCSMPRRFWWTAGGIRRCMEESRCGWYC